ncbi:MAG TPA: HEAT repeat domain-containing protein [Polyangiaceae bacterium]
MSLSSLIVQREVATMRQVEEALARQVIYGGDLATNLLEVARIDEEVLANLVAESLQLQAAPAGELPIPQERVKMLVPPEMAAQQTIAPLSLEGESLVVAVAEPMPGHVHEQLSFALGLAIEQRVALAVRVRQAIARVYAMPLERRMQRLVARLAGEPSTTGSMPPPLGTSPAVPEPPRPPSAPPVGRNTSRSFPAVRPSGEMAPVSAPPVTAPYPLRAPPPTTTSTSTPAATSTSTATATATATEPAPPVEHDSSPPVSLLTSDRRAGLLQREAPAAVRASRRRRGPLTLDVAKKEAEEAADRDALLDLFFDYSRQYFDYAAMFLVHGDIAEGRDAYGDGASRDRVIGIGMPLDLPGLMSSARDKRMPVVARAQADGLDAVLLSDLQRARDAEIALIPLIVRTRAVAVLMGDCGAAGIDRSSVQQVVGFAGIIGKAFERIIVRRKLEGFIAGNRSVEMGRVDPGLVGAKRKSSKPPPVAAAAPESASASARAPESAAAAGAASGPASGAGAGAAVARLRSVTSSAPPPVANIASLRPIGGPPIPREEPSAPRADFDPDDAVLFDELGWDASRDAEVVDAAPASAAILVSAHAPAARRLHRTDPPLPSVIVDVDGELLALVDRISSGAEDEQAEGELLRQGERAMRVIMTRFPGPVTYDRARIATAANPPRASDCGPVLRLVARQRKVALPFVLEKLAVDESETRGWATHVLAELPYVEALPPLLGRLRDNDAATRASAAIAIAAVARMYPDEARRAVQEMTHSSDRNERVAAMRAMGELREPAIVPDLVRALGDGDESVVEAAHDALVQVTRQDLGNDARRWLRWWEQNAQRHRMEWLIDALTHEVAEIRRAAGEELRALSKEYFGYASDLPARDRERAQQRYRDWWITEGRARFRRKA